MANERKPWARKAGVALLSLGLALAACQRQPTPQESDSPSATPSAQPTPEPAPSVPEPSPSPTLALPVKPTPETPMTPADTAAALPAMALPPRDDCAALPGWSAFAARLAATVKARDAAALATLSSPDVTLDYGGGHGPAELQKRLSAPSGQAVWTDLARILPLGCAVQGDLVVLPWFFWNVPDEVDPGMTMLVTGQGVPLRAKPSDTAQEVDKLDWSLVTLGPGFNPAAHYTAVITGKPQRKGYIETARLRSLLARRVIAERKGEDWHISALVAGD